MTDKTNTTEKKKTRRIKATTGAWWKSTIVEEVDEAKTTSESVASEFVAADTDQASSPQVQEPRSLSPEREDQGTIRDYTKATDKKAVEAESTQAVQKGRDKGETIPEEVDSAAVAVSEEAERVPSKKPRKRPSRNRAKTTSKDSVSEQLEATEESPEVTADVPAEATAVEPKTARKRPSRGRRKKSVQKEPPKELNGEQADSDQPKLPADEQVVGETYEAEGTVSVESPGTVPPDRHEADAETVSETLETEQAEAKPKRSGQRRSRRKKKERQSPVESEEAPEIAVEVDVDEEEDYFEDEDEDDLTEEDSAKVPELPEEDERDKDSIVLKLLINAEEPEECRLALLENGRLESIHVSTINRTQTKNNIYKGRIVAIEPNLQAAFVDYGTEKNGFLPFSEIHPEYYKQELSPEIQALVEAHHWKKLSIADVVEKGQDVMVQVVKEEVGKKGANMTTYLSLPGRSVVLMPGSDSSGISRKISGEERRSQLRTAMNSLGIPEGIGWIVRTASADITKTALARDVGYLLRLWEDIKEKAQAMDGVGQVYEDHQSVLRFLREHFDPAIEEILVDDHEAMEQVKQFIALLPSKQRDVKVRLHKGTRPIFNQFSVEDQIESIYQPKVNLPSGGSIVIDPTEALVAIDVNSGSTSKGKNFDQSIYQANMEAAAEIGRQLRLRDLGGLIVVDFIDMRNKKHIRDVERQLKLSMKRDKAKVDFSRISKFGLMQISRQKLGSPIEAGNYRVCQHCKGRGTVRSVETLALFYLRRIQTGASRKHVQQVECRFPLDVATYLLNNKRHEIHEHETRYKTEIIINADPEMSPVEHDIILHKGEKEPNGKKQG